MRKLPFLAFVAAVSVMAIPRIVAAQMDQLVQRVPSAANALVLVNADKVMSSPVARAGNWKADSVKRFDAGLTNVPPEANLLVLSSQLNLELLRPIWEAALMQSDAAPELSALARDLGGTVGEIAGLPAVYLSDDSYIVKFSDNVVGAIAPANRQLAARWVREPGGRLSPFLQKAITYVEGSAGVIMALDLTDAVTVEDVEEAIQVSGSELSKDAKVDRGELAKVLASINGVVLGVTFSDQVAGKIIVEFGRDASSIGALVKPVLLDILGERGVMIKEFADWNVTVAGTRVSLDGKLTDSGLTRLSSMVELPTQMLNGEKKQRASTSPDSNDSSAKVYATQQYFKSINHLLNDLKVQQGESKTVGQIGQWYDSYARNIEQLPLLNIDEQMLKYGDFVASQLRDASMALKGVGIRTRAGQVNAVASGVNSSSFRGGGFGGRGYAGYGYYGGSWTRGMGLVEQQSARTRVKAAERAAGAVSVHQIMQQITSASAQIRREMSQKYQVEF